MTDPRRPFVPEFGSSLARCLFGQVDFVIDDEIMSETYTEEVSFPVHPFIKWLAQYINIDTQVRVTYTRRRPRADVFQFNGHYLIHSQTFAQLKRQIQSQN